MVKCNKIEGKPCKCELGEPRVKYLIQTITRNTLKTLLGTITGSERLELRAAAQIPNAKIYLQMYLEQLDVNREYVYELTLEE